MPNASMSRRPLAANCDRSPDRQGRFRDGRPTGASLRLAAIAATPPGIFVIDAAGTGERRLTETGGWPVWWPDGGHTGYRVIGPTGDQEIHLIPLQGGPSTHLTGITFNGWNQPFDVSADAATIVTSNSVHLSDEIWLMEPRR